MCVLLLLFNVIVLGSEINILFLFLLTCSVMETSEVFNALGTGKCIRYIIYSLCLKLVCNSFIIAIMIEICYYERYHEIFYPSSKKHAIQQYKNCYNYAYFISQLQFLVSNISMVSDPRTDGSVRYAGITVVSFEI